MGRTVPSFRIALAMEDKDWTPFRNAFDKKDRRLFDEMFELPKFYISTCSNSVQYVRLHPIMISILLNHYKELKECIREVEGISGIRLVDVDDDTKQIVKPLLQTYDEMVEEMEEEIIPTNTLDGFFLIPNHGI